MSSLPVIILIVLNARNTLNALKDDKLTPVNCNCETMIVT